MVPHTRLPSGKLYTLIKLKLSDRPLSINSISVSTRTLDALQPALAGHLSYAVYLTNIHDVRVRDVLPCPVSVRS